MKPRTGAATGQLARERLAAILADVPFVKIGRRARPVKVDGSEVDAAIEVAAVVFDRVFIERSGLPNPRIERRALRSIFATRASRVLRVLLDDTKHPWRVQELARAASISLGLASKVKRRLVDLEYVRETGQGIELVRPEDLLRDWAVAGLPRRREQLDCYAAGEPAEIEAAFQDFCLAQGVRAALTSYSGAARVAAFPRYSRVSACVDADPAAVAAGLGWKPVPAGANVTLLAAPDEGVWYGLQRIGEDVVVSDVQLYLDLAASGGRGADAAAFVLEQRLRPRW
jgi:hypothetical protein